VEPRWRKDEPRWRTDQAEADQAEAQAVADQAEAQAVADQAEADQVDADQAEDQAAEQVVEVEEEDFTFFDFISSPNTTAVGFRPPSINSLDPASSGGTVRWFYVPYLIP
jgi:hypothetical protein